jgi:hypothetical protein
VRGRMVRASEWKYMTNGLARDEREEEKGTQGKGRKTKKGGLAKLTDARGEKT